MKHLNIIYRISYVTLIVMLSAFCLECQAGYPGVPESDCDVMPRHDHYCLLHRIMAEILSTHRSLDFSIVLKCASSF